MGNRYSNVLTALIIIAIIGIVGLLIFFGIDIYNKYYLEKETGEAVSKFDNLIPDIVEDNTIIDSNANVNNNTVNNESIENEVIDPTLNLLGDNTNNNNSATTTKKPTYKGFIQEGTINIPRTGLSCPILENAGKKAIEVAVGIQITENGLNQVGNTIIAGHNYRNGTLFSNNKNIQIGDKILVKDTSGLTVTYIVYDKFETTPEDITYIHRDTNGKREITLYTCNDDSSRRIIIEAREQ